MKLISMTDFVLDQEKVIPSELNTNPMSDCDRLFVRRVIGYGRFLKQPLKLEMFVPCDDKGNVLENPICQVELEQYRKAKEKVLFEGFECIKECDDYLCLTHENITIYYNIEEQIFILDDNDDTVLAYIECLCNDFNYTYRYTTLTPNATKQFL